WIERTEESVSMRVHPWLKFPLGHGNRFFRLFNQLLNKITGGKTAGATNIVKQMPAWLNVPNALTGLRLALVPFIIQATILNAHRLALILFLTAGFNAFCYG